MVARINRESISTLIVDARGATAGAAEFDRASAKIRSAASASQRIVERTNVILGEQSKKFRALVREIDPATLAQEKFARHLKTLDNQFKGNTGLPEYTRLLRLLEGKYKDTGAAAEIASERQAAALNKMRARYNPLFAANEKYKAELRDLMEAQTAGAIDEPTFRREHARIEQDFNPASISARKLAEAETKLAAEQRRASEEAAKLARQVDLTRAKFDATFATTLRFRDALAELANAEEMGALKGAALEAEIARVFDTLHPSAVAARDLAKQQAELAAKTALAAQEAANEARALDLMRREFDPAFAAARRYQDAIDKVIEAQRRGALTGQPFADAVDRIERELNPLSIAANKAAEAQAKLGDRGRRLVETIDPMARATRHYNEAVAEANELLGAGAITQAQHNQALIHAADAYDQAAIAADEFRKQQTAADRLMARRITQLSPQISDITTQLLSGTSPFTILVQQGPQIADIWGGIPTVLRSIPPHVYAIGAAFAAVATVGIVVGRRVAEISAQFRQLEGIARTVNPQIDGMNDRLRDLTLEIERAGSSRKDAISAVAELARVRQMGAGLIGELGALSPDVVTQLGGTVPQAAQRLAEAFSGGSAAIRELDASLNFLYPDELKQIEALERQGDRAGMLRIALNALSREYQGEGRRAMSAWTEALENIGNAWDTLIDKITRYPLVIAALSAIGGGLRAVTEMLPGATPQGAPSTNPRGAVPGEQATAQIAALAKQANEHVAEINRLSAEALRLSEAGMGSEADVLWQRAGELNGHLNDLKRQIRDLERAPGMTPPANRNGLTSDEQKRVNTARGILDAENEALKANRVQRQINMAAEQALQSALAANRSPAEAAVMADQARERAIRDLNIAIRDENEALDLNAAQTLKVADGYRHSTLEGLRAIAMRQAMTDQMNTGADAVERANRLLRINAAQSFEQTGRMFDTANLDLANQNDIANASGGSAAEQRDAERRAEAERAYRDAINDAAAAHDTRMVEALTNERSAYEQVLAKRDQYTRQTNVIAQMRRGFGEDVAMLELEFDLVGKTNVEREREITLLRVRQALLASGAPAAEAEAELDRLRQIIGLRAEANEKTRRATELFERNRQAMIDTADIMRDGFEDAVLNGEKLSDVIRNISRALLQLGMDVVVMAPIKDALNAWMQGGGSNPAMTGPITEGSKGTGIWGTLASLAQTGLNMWSGWSAGTGPSLMPNAANDPGALSAGALKANWSLYPVSHQGWEVGNGPPPAVRAVPSSVFVNAPKFHGGGLLAGERAIIAQDGEEILTARDPRHRRNFRNGGGNTIVMNITTPDANSFRQSQGQITAAASRSLGIAGRRNG